MQWRNSGAVMFNTAQWITWEPVQFPNEPKPRKIPCGGNDAHNPVNWMPHNVASSVSKNIGFVLTPADPYFCIDIDHALQSDGTWSPVALQLCGLFPGAYIEVSYSGDGLHIIAQGIIPDGFKHKNSALGIENYDRLRYIAITGTNATGTPDINHQEALNAVIAGFFEQATETTAADWTTTARADWNGPLDDDELIDRMLKSRPSANALWGGTATIPDLWEANTSRLIESYPDGAGWYDESSVDIALASHLAFWTGCNCERIERIMFKSKLVRPKWTEHKTYLRHFTIPKAVGACQNVYKDPRAPGVSTSAAPSVVGGAMRQGVQVLTADAQLERFKGCVYIINTHRVLRPNGTLITPEQFKAVYGGFEYAMDNINDKTSKNAWEVFSNSRAVDFPKVESVFFRPELEPGAIVEYQGTTYANSYYPCTVQRVNGDPGPFIDILMRLFPDERDRLIILSYMAACVQHIGFKFQWAPIIQGAEGNGKSFLAEALIQAIGDRLSHTVNPKDIANKFNAWIEGKVFACIEEVYVSDKRDVIDALKILITNRRVEIQPKGGNQYMGDNRVNMMLNTNHPDAIRKTRSDRRYAPFFTPQQSYDDIIRDGMGGSFFNNLYDWARGGGYAIIADYLHTFEIPDEFNPATSCHRAPTTTSTETAIKVSQGPVEQEIENAIGEGIQGFRNGWVSAMALEKLLQKTGKARMIPRNRRTEILGSMGYIKVGRSTIEVTAEGGRPMLYRLPETPATDDFTGDYARSQGYATF